VAQPVRNAPITSAARSAQSGARDSRRKVLGTAPSVTPAKTTLTLQIPGLK
jgi:hypothetical protein